MEYINQYLSEAAQIVQMIDKKSIQKIVDLLLDVRKADGRLFFIGAGGSAANASHAVNDFRKIAGFEAYTPTDNVSELTARTNDEGWNSVFVEWDRKIIYAGTTTGVYVLTCPALGEPIFDAIPVTEWSMPHINVGAP